jgi:hypothetical protein
MKLPPIAATLLKVLLVLFIIPALVGIYWLWLIWRYNTPYHRIASGDTEGRVVALLGKPYEVSAQRDALKETWADEEGFGVAQREIVNSIVTECLLSLVMSTSSVLILVATLSLSHISRRHETI